MGLACADEESILDDPDFAEGDPFGGVINAVVGSAIETSM